MRTKKDPDIRRDVFIKAATTLFIEKGYEAVSVRNVLAEVADKSASPSVFYYYFKSKDDLYHACIEGIAEKYVAGFREEFSARHSSLEEWMISHIDYMKNYLVDYLESERNIMLTGGSAQNRMFILDMRQKVTMQVADIWTESLAGTGLFAETEAKMLSRYLSGGVSEMIYNYMLEENKTRDRVKELIRDLIRFSANTIGLTEEQKNTVMERYEAGTQLL